MKTFLLRALVFAALGALALPVPGRAQDAALKQRLVQRLPAIDDLKMQKVVGENNRGYLEARENASAEALRLVQEENRDREAVYDLIAQQNKTTKDTVGRKRAEAISANSAKGVLVQGLDGAWAEKK